MVVSFYTKNTPYADQKPVLEASCAKYGIDCEITAREDRGLWSKNCCQKPAFLREKLKEHKRPLVWTDIDSIFLQKPAFFDSCKEEFSIYIDPNADYTQRHKVLTGTIFMRPTPKVFTLLDLWEQACVDALKTNPSVWDQTCLRDVLQKNPRIVEKKDLPRTYILTCDIDPLLYKEWSQERVLQMIFEKQYREENIHPKDAVILHYRASRLYRWMIDNNMNKDQVLDLDMKARLFDKVSQREVHENFLPFFLAESQEEE